MDVVGSFLDQSKHRLPTVLLIKPIFMKETILYFIHFALLNDISKCHRTSDRQIRLECNQCDQIGRFIGLWATFKAFGNY